MFFVKVMYPPSMTSIRLYPDKMCFVNVLSFNMYHLFTFGVSKNGKLVTAPGVNVIPAGGSHILPGVIIPYFFIISVTDGEPRGVHFPPVVLS